MRIAFILLAHENAGVVLRLVEVLLDADPDCHVVAHYDRRSPKAEFRKLEEARQRLPRFHLVANRVVCAWGEFGLVDGVVKAMRHIRDHDVPCDREMLISASCWPVRPLAQLKRYLAEQAATEFIQCEDESWIVGGLRQERYRLRFWFNEREQRSLFRMSQRIQQKFRLKRKFPGDLIPRFGSQWWCLTRKTCDNILQYIDENKKHYDFFRTTWIPDELCLQTLVYHLVPKVNISGKPLTFFKFTNHGKPLIFFDDHIEYIKNIDQFFVRKISSEAKNLQEMLAVRAAAPDDGAPLSGIVTDDGAYEVEINRRVVESRPGQIFWGDQIAGSWPGALAKSRGFLVVLFGPGTVVRQASSMLQGAPGMEVLGRVFKKNCVDFGEGRSDFRGMHSNDVAIRDEDCALYLSRVIDRTEALPVIELSPIDRPRVIWGLLESENVIFMPVMPNLTIGEEAERLFLALAVAETAPQAKLHALGSHLVVRHEIDGLIRQALRESDQNGLRDRVLRPHVSDRVLPLHFGAFGGRAKRPSFSREEEILYRSTGGAASVLLDATAKLRSQLVRLSLAQILASVPAHWRDYFMAALGPIKKPSTRPASSPPAST